MKKFVLFAASGSASDPEKTIVGNVNGITFESREFCGSMNGQAFWDRLAEYARVNNVYVRLVY